MIYFDNAATSGTKPAAVVNTVMNTIKYLSANPGRSGHSLSVSCAQIVNNTREKVMKFFGGSIQENVIFTKNCTEALNLAILGTMKPGGHVIVTGNEHNSVLRPVYEMEREKLITVSVANPDESGTVTAAAIRELLTPETYLICCCHVSNVTGGVAELAEIGKLAREKNILLLADCAQSAGHAEISADAMNIDLIAFAGHKGLYAPQGSGGLYFGERVKLRPVMFGGTGTESQSVYQPAESPEAYESGTLNTPAIAGLNAGINWASENAEANHKRVKYLTGYLCDGLSELPYVTIRSARNGMGIVSFEVQNLTSTDVADILNTEYNIATRGGLHCAPFIHRHLKTTERGLTRVSCSPFNTKQEADRLLYAMKNIYR